MEPDAVKEQQRSIYALGDYSVLSRWFAPAAEDLVAAAGVGPGDRVLDVAAGDGNVAVAAARRGATVTAVDLTPQMVEAGRARTAAEELAVTWMVGDAEALPVPGGAFSHVLSTFGVMYAPRPHAAAAELLRCAAPGGTVGVVSWPPGGMNDRLYAEAAPFLGGGGDETDDAPGPEMWGDPSSVTQLLARGGARVEVVTRPLTRRTESLEAMWDEAARDVPVLVLMRDLLSAEQFEAYGRAYVRVVADYATDEGDGVRVDLDYTRAIARLPG